MQNIKTHNRNVCMCRKRYLSPPKMKFLMNLRSNLERCWLALVALVVPVDSVYLVALKRDQCFSDLKRSWEWVTCWLHSNIAHLTMLLHKLTFATVKGNRINVHVTVLWCHQKSAEKQRNVSEVSLNDSHHDKLTSEPSGWLWLRRHALYLKPVTWPMRTLFPVWRRQWLVLAKRTASNLPLYS